MFSKACILIAAVASLTAVKAQTCSIDVFQAILPEGATALSAISVPDDGTFGDPTEIAYPGNASALPALCAVTINVTSSPSSSFRFGLFLPEDWNGRFSAVGNGGLAGGINWPAMGIMARYGFAVMSTDTGHNGTSIDGRFVLNGPETITDWQYRAMHGSVSEAKAIVKAHYGHNISYSYYNGCSTGGRQGLLEMQLYPEDFDGILAGAPAWESNKIAAYMVQMGSLNLPNTSDHHIPPTLYPLIEAEALRQCDPVDGVTDGVISDPQACHFRPETLLCNPNQNTSSSACLTAPQLNTLHLLYGHHSTIANPLFYHPLSPGTEADWPRFLPADAPLILGTSSLAYLGLQDPTWDWRSFNYSIVLDREATGDRRGIPEHFAATREFAARGAKLLHYHGLADTLIPWASSRTFYEMMVAGMSVVAAAAQEGVAYDVDDFYRLFFVPGLLHCSGGAGEAPWYIGGAGSMPAYLGEGVHSVPGQEDAEHDAVLALVRWVEEGVKPEFLVTTKWEGDDVEGQVLARRKACPYPGRAALVHEGADPRRVESWVCSE
ncbi:uncharacterized protein HMPREF1541_03569 [Cyphellophora europaea CBS 101466]|uniref:Carboxylic ester hydrolase n=1 Tax=Cyphellophora europaea (strain CBS 101466) TaxID=1220924 RepID=W2S0R1_CYPE1|nr:uncharacterized protein HMPREF1541_03569 [Cyphellophora europaea CBS 101466]ETN41633.1 hypothetical protein HMPREF1541_03569 [Cyphellophora europaea CBS 101466]